MTGTLQGAAAGRGQPVYPLQADAFWQGERPRPCPLLRRRPPSAAPAIWLRPMMAPSLLGTVTGVEVGRPAKRDSRGPVGGNPVTAG